MVGNGSGRRKCGGCFENLVVAPEKIFDCRVGVVLGPTSRSFPQAGLFVFGPSSVHVSLIYCGYNIYLKTRHKT